MKKTKKTTVKKQILHVSLIIGAVICIVASLIHSFTDYIQPDLHQAQSETKKDISLRKKAHAKLLKNTLDYNDGLITLEEFDRTNPSLIESYRNRKAIATASIANRKSIEAKYKINRFKGLQPFLYSFGNALTITFAGILFFLISLLVSDYYQKMAIRFVSASFLSLGFFWISWALFQEGDYKDIGYYGVMVVVALFVVLALSFLFRSFTASNDKIKALTSFIVRTRARLFTSYESSMENAQDAKEARDEHDNDMYETFQETK